MSKYDSFEERKKVAQELVKDELKSLSDLLGPSEERKESLKSPIEKLKSYQVIVECSFYWASRQAYLEMLQSFLLKKINSDTLSCKFVRLRSQNRVSAKKLCVLIEDQIFPISDLYYTSKAYDFTRIIDDLYLEIERSDSRIEDQDDGSCNDFNDFIYSDRILRLIIQKKFVPKLQQSCDLNDSFFQLQVDLNQLIRRSYLILIVSSLGLCISLIPSIW